MRQGITAALLLLMAACTERTPATRLNSAPVPKSRFVLIVLSGNFAATVDTRLEAELTVALSRQADLEIISASVAETAVRKQRLCDPEQADFGACRARQLGVVGDFLIKLEMGVVPGTWVLTSARVVSGAEPEWSPTLPFTQQRGESLDDAVARAGRLLGESLGPAGIRSGSNFAPARPAAGSFTEFSELCSRFTAPDAPLNDLVWATRNAVRAHLHRSDRETDLEAAIGEVNEVARSGPDDCRKLSAVVAWQQRAVSKGWLPTELGSETWRANVDIQLRGDSAVSPDVSEAVGTSFAGAFALRGFTLHSIHPAGERCEPGPDCVEGIPANEVRPRVWVMVIDVAQSSDSLGLVGKLLVPDGDKVKALTLPKIQVPKGTLLKPAIDSAVATALAEVTK